jgi:hypothetical protein
MAQTMECHTGTFRTVGAQDGAMAKVTAGSSAVLGLGACATSSPALQCLASKWREEVQTHDRDRHQTPPTPRGQPSGLAQVLQDPQEPVLQDHAETMAPQDHRDHLDPQAHQDEQVVEVAAAAAQTASLQIPSQRSVRSASTTLSVPKVNSAAHT